MVNESVPAKGKLSDNWRQFLWITLACIVVYAQTLTFGFTYLDDHKLVLNNSAFLQDATNVGRAFTEDLFRLKATRSYYRPLCVLSFMFDAQVGAMSPWMFHLSNVVFHILASCALFLVLQQLGHAGRSALVPALLFAVHPAASHAVCWIPARNDLMLAFFALMSLFMFLAYMKSGRVRHGVGHLLCYALSLLAKETALVLPGICVVYVVFKSRLPGLRRLLLGPFAVGWLVITLGWYFVRRGVIGAGFGVGLDPLVQQAPAAVQGMLHQFGKAVFPVGLSVLPEPGKYSLIPGLVAVVLVVLLLGSRRTRSASGVLGVVWSFAFLAPALAVPGIPDEVRLMGHRLYVPLAGVMLLLAGSGLFRVRPFAGRRGSVCAGTLVVLLAVASCVHSRGFRDRHAFWRKAVESAPHSAMAHANMGLVHYLDGESGKAENEYRYALDLDPAEATARINLGIVCAESGREEEAERHLLTAIELTPTADAAYYNLSLLYARQGKEEEAIATWFRGERVNPRFREKYWKNMPEVE